MAITDLTGYTWVGNDTIDISTTFSYSLTFSVGTQSFTAIKLESYGATGSRRRLLYGSTSVYLVLMPPDSSPWQNEAYKTIQITGGGSVANPTLIAWLEANGTLTPPATGYSITYHANGGAPEPVNRTGQTALPSPLPPISKSGHRFDGWFTNSIFTTPAVAGATIEADTDLYAKFTRTHITLDLSTIGLPAGTHSIQMRLSDDGVTKRDSALSNAVTYTVSTWEYPVEDGDNLIITQANTITEDGDYLIIE